MRNYTHIDAETVDEVVTVLRDYGDKASVIAGGTDLLCTMKDEILPVYPEVLINIKKIPDLQGIKEEGGVLKLGALTTLTEITDDVTIKSKYTALADAALAVGSPQLRNTGTIAGNLCQDIRCWYYRSANNYFYCFC